MICRTRPAVRIIQVLSEEANSLLQNCFGSVNWEVFAQRADLEEYTSAVLACIHFCTDTGLTTKSFRVYPNQKLLMDRNVQSLLRV